jgi:hypothetical protein
MAVDQSDLMQTSDELYERYAKPLESEHAGKYVAISPDGQVLLGDTLLDVARQATERFGRGNFVFKIGPRAVGKWR